MPTWTVCIPCGDAHQSLRWLGYAACSHLAFLRGLPFSTCFIIPGLMRFVPLHCLPAVIDVWGIAASFEVLSNSLYVLIMQEI